MNKKYLKLNDVRAYVIAFQLSNYVWDVVAKWDWFVKKSFGSQFTRAVDSISANIAEGFFRYFKKEKVQFYRYNFGSIGESLDWNEKAKRRGLLTNEQYNHIFQELQKLPQEVHHLIRFTNEKLSK
ncbi:four helix bundle protein [Patescibacteria group bacterium]|nr:four helix bundle protein [Patescibacteria group bacterium]MBU4512353.1 four helix bundle protein [Patescibacteria group bacterium]